MEKNIYQTENHNLQTTFGGLIYLSDYNTECRSRNFSQGSAIADRIARDKRFDEECRKKHSNAD